MAESIALLFRRAGWDEIAAEVASFAGAPHLPHQWWYPAEPAESSLHLYRYDDGLYLLDEYEPEALDRVLAALGGFPSAILVMEMRRSQGRRAVDDAASLTLRLLRRFDGVADDLAGELWTREEMEGGAVKAGGGFLDVYRYPAPDGG